MFGITSPATSARNIVLAALVPVTALGVMTGVYFTGHAASSAAPRPAAAVVTTSSTDKAAAAKSGAPTTAAPETLVPTVTGKHAPATSIPLKPPVKTSANTMVISWDANVDSTAFGNQDLKKGDTILTATDNDSMLIAQRVDTISADDEPLELHVTNLASLPISVQFGQNVAAGWAVNSKGQDLTDTFVVFGAVGSADQGAIKAYKYDGKNIVSVNTGDIYHPVYNETANNFVPLQGAQLYSAVAINGNVYGEYGNVVTGGAWSDGNVTVVPVHDPKAKILIYVIVKGDKSYGQLVVDDQPAQSPVVGDDLGKLNGKTVPGVHATQYGINKVWAIDEANLSFVQIG